MNNRVLETDKASTHTNTPHNSHLLSGATACDKQDSDKTTDRHQ
jgi:hypothetical protein